MTNEVVDERQLLVTHLLCGERISGVRVEEQRVGGADAEQCAAVQPLRRKGGAEGAARASVVRC